MKIGVLRETKFPVDTRVALTPKQCKTIGELPDMQVYVQPSAFRCFTNAVYEKEGVVLKENLDDCDVLIGIKEVAIEKLIPGKTYLFFSHTIKKQEHNKRLLKEILKRNIRLIDYEMLTDSRGIRIIGFGRWAGLIGAYHGLRAICKQRNTADLPLPQDCQDLIVMMKQSISADPGSIRMVITGDGRVASGAEEMMAAFGIQKVTLDDYLGKKFAHPVYLQLDPEKYNKRKDGGIFTLSHFFSHPELYESNFARFCDKTDLLIMAAYWDPKAPMLFTREQMKEKDFKIKVIADISCDLHGSVPSTIKTTTFDDPYYDFNPLTGTVEPPFSGNSNITVMAIDNLPCGLPRESSADFGQHLIRSVLPLFSGNDPENTIERATIAKNGKLTENYWYLNDWVNQQE
jgi:alanine dehydrogenase